MNGPSGNTGSSLSIVSGGQTGVDRAALEAAIAAGVPYGGWCPTGGAAEDLPVPPGRFVLALDGVPLAAAHGHGHALEWRTPYGRGVWTARRKRCRNALTV